MTHYHAGWNMPGYLPEMDPATFAVESDACAFVDEEERDQIDRLHEECDHPEDGDCPDEITDIYVYWVESCNEPDCEVES